MDISRTYSANGYAFIINLLCLVKFFTECMFLGEPQCYKQAFHEEAIYFVNRSYFQDEGITYKQITCYSREENTNCKSLTTDHISNCTKLNRTKTFHIAKMPQHSFIVRCPLLQQGRTYLHRARAFRKDSILKKSKQLRENSVNTCYCNWSDIRSKASFQTATVEFPVNEPLSIQLAFKLDFSPPLKIKLYLAANSNLIPICEEETNPSHNVTIISCSSEKLIGCDEPTIVVKLQSNQCLNTKYEFNITAPTKPGRGLEIFENNFICNKHNDGVEIFPILFDRSYTYFVKNASNSDQKVLLSRRRIKLRGKYGRDIEIKVCKMDCICSQYMTLNNCHFKQTTQKISQTVLTVILVSISLLLTVIICAIIRVKTRNKNTNAQEITVGNIFDDSSVGLMPQPYKAQLQQNCQTVDVISIHKKETYDQISIPHTSSL